MAASPKAAAKRGAPAPLIDRPHRFLPADGGELTLGGVPTGVDALVLAEVARLSPKGVIHIAPDDAAVDRLQAALSFFAPDVPTRQFPAWDCLPYDRASPRPELQGQRLDTLSQLLAHDGKRPLLLLTTVNAVTQRVLPPSVLSGAVIQARVGGQLSDEQLKDALIRTGYSRTDTVREPGEFAIRGGIIDLFPAGEEDPLRLDLFGDEVESIRTFDPLTQRTQSDIKGFVLRPASEVFLDPDSIQRFRTRYREAFGAVRGDDPLYEAVSSGRKFLGMEHWLPLFHDLLATLFDYLPGAIITRGDQTDEQVGARWAMVTDFYEARTHALQLGSAGGGAIYKPVAPGEMFLGPQDVARCLSHRGRLVLSPFKPVDGAEGQVEVGGRRGHDFTVERKDKETPLFEAVRSHVVSQREGNNRVLVAAYSEGSRERLQGLFNENGIVPCGKAKSWDQAAQLPKRTIAMVVLGIESGFTLPGLTVLSEQDILGDRVARAQARRKRKADNFLTEVSSLHAGDLVVHVEHGIGRFEGLETLDTDGAAHDCVKLSYQGGTLFVPVENIDVLSRYGKDGETVALDRLGGAGWQARKAAVKKRLKDMADALMKVAASRMLRTQDPLPTPDAEYNRFAAGFPYAETDDQLNAIGAVQEDLLGGRAMDRLVCGDVGFGKTEVALRAAFIAAINGMQVAVVTPTTLLARQHYRNFVDRFRDFPIQVGQLSRLVTGKEAKQIKDGLARGDVNIVIGTHALLANSIRFDHLGLLIVDEEQRFGVKQKEKLKQLKSDVHVLTLTATPIPRTLQLAMAGVRELSLIATPPVDRLAVRTFVLPFDPVVVREALMREHFRGGQSFVVCPRIEDLKDMQERLAKLAPELKVVVAHGRLPAAELEEVMGAFIDAQYDVLLATNIIESGIDIPNANTLVVHRADLFGLAQLYQIRGRIGRGKIRGYAYLTHDVQKPISKSARERLHIIETLDTLGAGFTLASHDMDIRGAGNLLGEEQSGHVKEVGVELYQQMLEEAVAAAKGAGEAAEAWSPQLHLGLPVMIPEDYVPDLTVRLSLYRRVSDLTDPAAVDDMKVEMIDRFGALPVEVDNLFTVVGLKALCRQANVERMDVGPKGAVITFREDTFPNVEGLLLYVSGSAGTIRIRPDNKLVVARGWEGEEQRLKGAAKVLGELAEMARGTKAG